MIEVDREDWPEGTTWREKLRRLKPSRITIALGKRVWTWPA